MVNIEDFERLNLSCVSMNFKKEKQKKKLVYNLYWQSVFINQKNERLYLNNFTWHLCNWHIICFCCISVPDFILIFLSLSLFSLLLPFELYLKGKDFSLLSQIKQKKSSHSNNKQLLSCIDGKKEIKVCFYTEWLDTFLFLLMFKKT